ncbi:MAG: TldD/PmbA family protein [Anaerolineae bacterium]|nr:TldD/PmbA family protein [Anaerolineae bacterium]MDH7473806.1 TldD/PmbA family protein [Anaerolineae bacterium]
MKELTARALNTAQVQGATYADIRIVRCQTQSIAVKNGAVEGLQITEEQGFGVRVIVNGAWGFAASARLEPAEVERVTALAVQIARASALLKREEVNLGPPEKHVATYRTPVQIDPFTVSLEEKIGLLLAADAEMRREPAVKVAKGNMQFIREHKIFASSEGSYIEQEIIESGCGLEATAVGEHDVQQRSYPNSFGQHQGTAGYELIQAMDLVGHAARVGAEAAALLSAPQCPSMTTSLILGSTQLALQVHESCGHPIELDRVFGFEAAYAGTSFLTPEKLGTFRYGSEIVNITADATIPGGLGTFGFDDEGIPAQRTPIVRHGLFVGYLTSRETAAKLGKRSNGAMRASGWNRIPIIRMTNINLESGEWDFDDLIADTDEGISMEMNKSWSIDDKRLNFQFGTEIAYEIRHGKLGRLYKNATYTGITPQFWASCDAICNEKHWYVWGIPNCGKGQPPQVAHVGHGTAPARFRKVQVGVMK